MIVSRAEWGAAPPTRVTKLSRSSVTDVFFHYSGMDADERDDHRQCAGRVRGIQSYHMSKSATDPTKPWSDIAYSFLTCKHGAVFEGRGLGVRTAATGPANGYSLAVCFLGNDSLHRDDLSPAGRRALVEATREIERWAKRSLAFHGHRDVMNTTCPGDEIQAYIESDVFRREVTGTAAELRKRKGFYAWAAWRLGEEDWKSYGPANPSVRPDVPAYISPLWWIRLQAMLAARR